MPRKKKRNKLPPFVYITKEMLESEEFKKLTNASRVTYLLLKAQCKKFDQKSVKFPYSHSLKYMNEKTFSRSIRQLEEMRFIEISQEGGLIRRTNVYTFIKEQGVS